jgi:hypothetical protein
LIAGAPSPSKAGLARVLLWLIPPSIALGALIDQYCAPWGQGAVSAIIWLLYLALLALEAHATRPALIACLIIATAGEVILSLVWGLYDYRLHNIPLFVPPGHVLLFWFGLNSVARVPTRLLDAMPLLSGIVVAVLAISGIDQLSLALWLMYFVCWYYSRSARRFYVWMFLIALAMEVFATWIGNWRWHSEVPLLHISTTNPPLAAGAFYCMLDVLVLGLSRLIHTRKSAAERRA